MRAFEQLAPLELAPEVLRQYLECWRVEIDGAPVLSPTGCVAFGRTADPGGTPRAVVVKVAGERSDEGLAWAALRHFDGRGSVRLLAQACGAGLLERALPGRPLSELVLAGRDDEATAILCDVSAALHRPAAPDAGSGFPSVTDWARGFDRYRRSGDGALPRPLVDRADALFRELAATQGAPRLLHGDLHQFNLVSDAERGWLAIDPKGVLGEPAYEFGALLRNPWGDGFARAQCASAPVVDRRIRIIAERLGLDRERVLAWGFAQAVLSAVWSREDGEAPDHALAVAGAIFTTLRGIRGQRGSAVDPARRSSLRPNGQSFEPRAWAGAPSP
jgi:streptomycin 6-kinase